MSIHNKCVDNRTDHPVSKQRSAETEKPSSPRTPRFSVRPIFEDISCCRRRAQRLRPNGSGKTFMSARRPNVICPGRWLCSLAPPQAQLLQDVGENAPRKCGKNERWNRTMAALRKATNGAGFTSSVRATRTPTQVRSCLEFDLVLRAVVQWSPGRIRRDVTGIIPLAGSVAASHSKASRCSQTWPLFLAPRHAPAPRAARRSPSFCARAFNRSFRKCCAGRRSHRLRVGGSQL